MINTKFKLAATSEVREKEMGPGRRNPVNVKGRDNILLLKKLKMLSTQVHTVFLIFHTLHISSRYILYLTKCLIKHVLVGGNHQSRRAAALTRVPRWLQRT